MEAAAPHAPPAPVEGARSDAVAAGLDRTPEAVLVGLATALVLAVALPWGLHVGAASDDAMYIALGKAIATGQGYRSIFYVGSPVQLKYPPGLPLVMAGLWAAIGEPDRVRLAGVVLNLAALGTTAALLWRIGRDRLGAGPLCVAAFALAPLALDAALVQYALTVTEPYYLLGWATALWLAYRLGDGDRPRLDLALVLGLVLAATALFRTQAVVLAAGLLAALALSRRTWRAAAVTAAAFAAPLAAWSLIHARMLAHGPVSRLPDEAGYWSWTPFATGTSARGLAVFLIGNVAAYWRTMGHLLSGSHGTGIVLAGLWGVGALAGALRAGRPHAPLLLSVAAAAASMILWPGAHTRLLIGFLPVVGLLVAYRVGLETAGRGRRARTAAAATVACAAVLVAGHQFGARRLAARQLADGTPHATYSSSYVMGWASQFIVRTADALDGRPPSRRPRARGLARGRLPAHRAADHEPGPGPERLCAHRVRRAGPVPRGHDLEV